MLLKSLTSLVILLAIACGSVSAHNYSDVDIDNRVLYIETFETTDLVLIGINGNEVEIHILNFAPDLFPEVPSFFEFTESELIAMAEDYRYEDRKLSRFDRADIRLNEGNDVLLVDTSVMFAVTAVGGDGDDYLQGGSANAFDFLHGDSYYGMDPNASGDDYIVGELGIDVIYGGPGNDQIYGGEGTDYLYGGDDDDNVYGEEDRDYVVGDAGADLLDGGYDGFEDYLYGGADVDTDDFRWLYYEVQLVPRQVRSFGWYWQYVVGIGWFRMHGWHWRTIFEEEIVELETENFGQNYEEDNLLTIEID